ncbi:unnamed protein product [Anisakis simplex]|uniref:Protein FRA10AC1 (inferred by orthology to a human protein) n=1 Tax=Anisakis simplex TaxID=6269 RepID=A0A0M3K5L0_ANISI|nr:unnamed protein product [Anisakis simplex]
MTKRNPIVEYDDLNSEFDYGSEIEREKKKARKLGKDNDLGGFRKSDAFVGSADRSRSRAAFDEAHAQIERQKRRLMTLDVYSRHKELINNYFLYYPGATKRLQRDCSNDRTDFDVLKERYRFLWDEQELNDAANRSWEFKLAKRYYDKLFKEYCIADLTFYKKNKIAMRWRVEKEVKSGKGQFECGNKHCPNRESLCSWEVNFGYVEDGQKKNALVKLRLCPECSAKLNYHSQKKRVEKKSKKPNRREKLREGSLSTTGEPSALPSCSQSELRKSRKNSKSGENDGSGNMVEETSEEGKQLDGEDGNGQSDSQHSTKTSDEKAKEDAKKLLEIWKKPGDATAILDEKRAEEEDLDAFLDEMFM